VPKPITRTTTTTAITTTAAVITDVLRHHSFANLGREASEGDRGLTASLQGGMEASEDHQLTSAGSARGDPTRPHLPALPVYPNPPQGVWGGWGGTGHTDAPRGALVKRPLCLRAPGPGPAAWGGHPAVADSCVQAPAGPRPSPGSAPPPSPPLRGGGGGGTESARAGGF